jgi:hypothetical protein
MVFHKSRNTGSMWKIVLPSQEDDDLQGLPHEEISKSEILDMVCAMRSVEATDR